MQVKKDYLLVYSSPAYNCLLWQSLEPEAMIAFAYEGQDSNSNQNDDPSLNSDPEKDSLNKRPSMHLLSNCSEEKIRKMCELMPKNEQFHYKAKCFELEF